MSRDDKNDGKDGNDGNDRNDRNQGNDGNEGNEGNDGNDRNEGNDDDDRGRNQEEYRLTVTLDVSDVEQLRENRPQDLHVVGRLTDDTLQTAPVELGDAEGTAELTFDDEPGAVGVYVGPTEVTPDELVKTQTLTENIPAQRWVETPEIDLDPIRIPPYYWDWWLRWCRTFTVRGKLTCPDGSPVPGATVCAKDVDSWFVWQSTQEVGCDTTDLDGTFEIEFRWCCGFWPWWWWQHRTWRPDDHLAELIEAATRDVRELSLAKSGNRPALTVFDDLLEDAPIPVDEPVAELDPDRLEQIRTDLVERLPRAPELRELGVWPWAPWQPWYDCRPDLIFEATQDGTVVLDQDVGDTMWDVSTSENVTLVTNDDAICGGDGGCQEPPCPGGECITVSGVCGVAINKIGGNRDAATTLALEGYANPKPTIGTGATSVDRPFAGRVFLMRNFETTIDYVELEYHDGSGWTPVPRDGLSDFEIGYIHVTGGTFTFPDARFEVTDIGGRWVVPTRERYEDTHSPLWRAEADRNGPGGPAPNADWWGSHQNRLFAIDSTYFSNNFGDGTYRFRLQGYEDVDPSDDEVELEDLGPVKRCFDEEDDQDGPADPVEVVLTFDNRRKVNVHSHPHRTSPAGSGSGTVHRPYVEPDTSIEAVRLTDADGNPVDVPVDEEGECPSVERTDGGYLEIDFIARDPVSGDNPVGHLSHYTLHATYGRSNSRNLLTQPSCEIDPQVSGSAYTGYKDSASPPDSKGSYGRAVDQGASRPGWAGGEYTLRMKVDEAFPKDCCYQLVLKARKRTIANCHTGWPHRNRSEYSIGYGI